ncbi:hypothetical protein ACFWHQ_19800 [Streptomyces sp. NPDC060334]|uniref:phage distal tail protein n=1 Tax=Streptomyces sp. NPDC060334 TaxID=3347099 RepID=UPI0036502431
MSALRDHRHELGGVAIGSGTPIVVATIEGLGRPEVRTGDVDPPHSDGVWLGADYYAGRTVRINAGIRTPGDQAAALDVLDQLQHVHDDPRLRLTGGATTELRLKLPGRDVRVLNGRLRRLDADLSSLVYGWIPLDLEFFAADPYFYSDDPQQITMPLNMVSDGGFTAPVVPPVIVNPGPDANRRPGWITVDGAVPAWPVLRINGPCVNPSVSHVQTGRSLQLNTTVDAGDWIEVDTRPTWRSVLRRGGGHVNLTPSSRIDTFNLPPGRSELRWQATDPTNKAQLTVSWRAAWATLAREQQ